MILRKRGFAPVVLIGLLAVLLVSACGGDDDDENAATTNATATTTASGSGAGPEAQSGNRIQPSITKVEKTVPVATETPSNLRLPGGTPAQMDAFLTAVLQLVDGYWTSTMAASGLNEPFVKYYWTAPGQQVQMACQRSEGQPVVTSDDTAAYCPADDTMYISQQFAINLWNGLLGGQQSGVRPGDFGVAYVVAHEYGHNIQHELGIYAAHPDLPTKNFELQADCLAGAWGNAAYLEGEIEEGDVEEAIATANLGGDYAYSDPGHHGTPKERMEAWVLGYSTGEPSQCAGYTEG
jgi:uncharacterized protein